MWVLGSIDLVSGEYTHMHKFPRFMALSQVHACYIAQYNMTVEVMSHVR